MLQTVETGTPDGRDERELFLKATGEGKARNRLVSQIAVNQIIAVGTAPVPGSGLV